MTSKHPLESVLAAAARGDFPAPDGTLAVVPAPSPYRGAVVAFSAHSFVAVDLAEDELRTHLRAGDLGAPVAAPFLAWLGERLGTMPGMLDVVLMHLGSMMTGLALVPAALGLEHARIAKAHKQRHDVQVFTDAQQRGVVMLGRGLVGRWEISLELDSEARGRGLGRAMIAAARVLVPADEPVFAQVSPGNAQSLRAFLAAGFRPIGSEVLFL